MTRFGTPILDQPFRFTSEITTVFDPIKDSRPIQVMTLKGPQGKCGHLGATGPAGVGAPGPTGPSFGKNYIQSSRKLNMNYRNISVLPLVILISFAIQKNASIDVIVDNVKIVKIDSEAPVTIIIPSMRTFEFRTLSESDVSVKSCVELV